jgi:hypothetical protein
MNADCKDRKFKELIKQVSANIGENLRPNLIVEGFPFLDRRDRPAWCGLHRTLCCRLHISEALIIKIRPFKSGQGQGCSGYKKNKKILLILSKKLRPLAK